MDEERITITLSGTFQLKLNDELDITPRGKRSRAIIALLLLSSNRIRPRKWIQDKLWSNKKSEQGAASLRQELSALKKHFALFDLVLFYSDRDIVRLTLKPENISIYNNPEAYEDYEFLGGVEIPDPEFEDWIRDCRMSYFNGSLSVLSEYHSVNTSYSIPKVKQSVRFGALGTSAIPTIYVSGFRTLEDTDRANAFAYGLTEEVLVIFGKLNGAFLLLTSPPGKDMSRTYELAGLIRFETKVRVTARLTQLDTGECVWSEKFDLHDYSGFDIQEEISRKVVENAQISLSDGDWARIWSESITSTSAWEAYQQGRILESRFRKDDTDRAIMCYRRALHEDSDFFPSEISLGFCLLDQIRLGWAISDERNLKQVEKISTSVLKRYPENYYAIALSAFMQNAKGNHDAACTIMQSAMVKAPSSPEPVSYTHLTLPTICSV